MPTGEHLKGKKHIGTYKKGAAPMLDPILKQKQIKSRKDNALKRRTLKEILNQIIDPNSPLGVDVAIMAEYLGIDKSEVSLNILADAKMIEQAIKKKDVQAYLAFKKVAGEIVDKNISVGDDGKQIKKTETGATFVIKVGDSL